MQAITYELKYCERCGSLRLRRADSSDTYCQPCGHVLFNLPLPGEALQSKLLLRKPRTPKDERPFLQGEARLELACGRAQ